ncbi:MAG: prepilin peptidase [Dehalococcoidia bacterium]|nr:prepilin peptidase [Dehalococcoidia bacterium]
MLMYLFIFLFFILGLFCGSLVNYIAGGVTREPRSFVFSICRDCNNIWRPLLMLPVIGFLLARGRCPHCAKPLPIHIILVEVGTGLLLAYLLWSYGFSWDLSVLIIYCLLLLILLVTDIEQMLIPNVVTYPGFLIVLLISLAIMLLNVKPHWFYAVPATGFFMITYNYLVNIILGGLAGFVLLLLVHILSRGGMALGDVKLAALIGMMTGFPLVVVALFLGVIGGGLVALILLLTRRRGRRDPMPFGPFLCLGGIAALLWGKAILAWYLAPIM